MRPVFVYVTCKNREEALQIGQSLVEARLAACANVIDGMESVYWWEGKVVTDKEAVLIMKTRSGLIKKLTKQVKELHSYSVPCVVGLPIEMGNHDYFKWIKQETGA